MDIVLCMGKASSYVAGLSSNLGNALYLNKDHNIGAISLSSNC